MSSMHLREANYGPVHDIKQSKAQSSFRTRSVIQQAAIALVQLMTCVLYQQAPESLLLFLLCACPISSFLCHREDEPLLWVQDLAKATEQPVAAILLAVVMADAPCFLARIGSPIQYAVCSTPDFAHDVSTTRLLFIFCSHYHCRPMYFVADTALTRHLVVAKFTLLDSSMKQACRHRCFTWSAVMDR